MDTKRSFITPSAAALTAAGVGVDALEDYFAEFPPVAPGPQNRSQVMP